MAEAKEDFEPLTPEESKKLKEDLAKLEAMLDAEEAAEEVKSNMEANEKKRIATEAQDKKLEPKDIKDKEIEMQTRAWKQQP
jgi:hypothetical protein